MQLEFELVSYDEALDKFDLDEKIYQMQISDQEAQTYELLKSSDMNLYNWLKESDFFIKFVREEVYGDDLPKKIAISEINGTTYRRFFFFKVTSGDSHYDYFKKLFTIYEESDWQDREEIGEEILNHLTVKRRDMIIDLENNELVENDSAEV